MTQTDLFLSGQEGYPTYRIPSLLVTQQGTLLVFCEGRAGLGDHNQNDIILKRSTDGGKTWGPLQLVASDGRNSLNDASTIVVRETDRVMVLYTRFPEGFHTDQVVPGYTGDRVSRSLLVYSDDDGRTWSTPREITKSVKRPSAVCAVFAPGIGCQLRRGEHKGRLVVPMWQGRSRGQKVYVAYSDDQGETWQYGDLVPVEAKGGVNESQVVELADGSVMMNARSWGGSKCRKVGTSKDGGQTWSGLVDDPVLIEPNCQAAFLRYTDPLDGQKSRILFSNPASTERRRNGVVRLSYDEGKTWSVSKMIYEGDFGYSCLTVLQDKTIGLLYERDGYEKITLARFDLDWLTDGKDRL